MSLLLHCRRTRSWARRGLLLGVLVLAFTASAYSQSAQPTSTPPSDPMTKDGSKDDPRFGSPEAEMRSKLAIKDEKKKYDEHLARAKEVSQLASQVSASFEAHQRFSPDDEKRLERMEKLTKRIRNDSGGSERDADADIK